MRLRSEIGRPQLMEEFVLLSFVLFSSNYLRVDKHILPFGFKWCYLCGYDLHQVGDASLRRNLSVTGVLLMVFLGWALLFQHS